MWSYLAYWNMFHEDLLRHCSLRFALIGLEAAKWAALSGNRTQSMNLLYATAPHAPLIRWMNIFLQCLLPAGVMRFIRNKRTVGRN
jgi:hypothetical protein